MWTLDSRWFDVAVFSTLWGVLVIVFGRFEQHKKTSGQRRTGLTFSAQTYSISSPSGSSACG
jgi:hypothetical protein